MNRSRAGASALGANFLDRGAWTPACAERTYSFGPSRAPVGTADPTIGPPHAAPPGPPGLSSARTDTALHTFRFTATKPQPISGSAYHPHLLVVDDNPGELGVLTEAVAIIDGAAEVESCTTGHLAMAELSVLAQRPQSVYPDLVVIDMRMPLISGADLLNGIRSQQELQTLRVVMITGGTIPSERRRCAQLGALAVIDKPADFAGFLSLARQLVTLARSAAMPWSCTRSLGDGGQLEPALTRR